MGEARERTLTRPIEKDVEGGCFCGRHRYRISGKPGPSAICHCRSCQRIAGAESVAWVMVNRIQVEFLGPAMKYFQSSAGIKRSFCAECGTCLTYECDAKTIDITIATLDDPERVKPDREIWLSHRISWNALNGDMAGFSGDSTNQ